MTESPISVCRQVRDRQRDPGAGNRLRATGPGPQPVGAERGGRLLVHRAGRHADQRQVRGRAAGIPARRRPSAHAAAAAARDRQAAPVPGHPAVHARTGLQQEEVDDAGPVARGHRRRRTLNNKLSSSPFPRARPPRRRIGSSFVLFSFFFLSIFIVSR